jgi:hypothetical protein
MTRKRKMTRPSDSNMIFEFDILFGLAFVDVSKRKALAWDWVISIPKLPKPSPSHQNAAS